MARITLGNRDGTLAVRHGRSVMESLAEEWPDLHLSIRTIPKGAEREAVTLLDALVKGKIDVAVVQMDSLGHNLPEGTKLAAVSRRSDPRSALVAKGRKRLADLDADTAVGVFSERDAAFLESGASTAAPVLLVGSPENELARLAAGEFGAILLPAATMLGLELRDRIDSYLDIDTFTPCPGQGAVGLVVRDDDDLAFETVYALQHRPSYDRVRAERAFAAALADRAVGAAATVSDDGELTLLGAVIDGDSTLQGSVTGEAREAEELGRELAQDVLDRSASAKRA